ncbi:hypothetical protein Q5P01_002812 [Channa striata]|uniref:Reelin domain-containing protein n=1 Tax=Channa striata TaxID=64152 RepID=A0AA88NSA3_CHASR|nr:hypothetical protein Q5P01_002812 [Channa striata]
MQSIFLCFGVGMVLFVLAPLSMSFSRGANHASCQEMIPGHIRAHPQNPQHSRVSLHTSASSYLPGQLITVTVRSSRDFMGFLIQARSMEGNVGRARTGVGPRLRSSRAGPVLVGGSWTFTPPGTHALRCLSEGDTLTHSDKQLKRNLSFVWRAPDEPMGDIRFYITVVQSYFVYWAGIESGVVRDGTTRVDGGSLSFAAQENEVTVLPALRILEASNNKTEGPVVTLGPHTKPRRTQFYKSLVTQTEATRPVLDINRSVTVAFLGTCQRPRLGLVLSFPLKFGEMEQKHPHSNFKESKEPIDPEIIDTTINLQITTTAVPSTTVSFHSRNPPRPTSFSSREAIQDQTSSVKFEALSSSPQPWRSSLINSQNSLVNKASTHKAISQDQTSLQSTNIPSTSATRQFPQSITAPHVTPAHPFSIQHLFNEHSPFHYQVVSDLPKPLPENQANFPQTDHSPEVLTPSSQTSSQPHSQIQAEKAESYGWKQHRTSVTPDTNTLLLTSRFDQTIPVDQVKEVKHLSSSKIKQKNPVSASGLLTPPPNVSESTQQLTLQSSSSTPTRTPLASTLSYHSATTPLYPLESSTLESTHPSFTSTFFTHSFSSSKTNQRKTVPAISALPSPSPVSIPPHFPSALPSSPSPVQMSLAPSTTSYLNSSNYPSTGPCFPEGSYISSATSSPSFSSPTSSSISLGSSSSSSTPATSFSSSSFHSTIPHPKPSPAPRKPTLGQRLLIQSHMASSNPKPKLHPPTMRAIVHPNPEPHPNLNPNFKHNFEQDPKPNFPKTDTNSKHPSNPPQSPENEGKYPDIVPRHSAWELGMLLGCTAGLGTVLVVGVRCIYRQACGKQTQMTLNNRERDNGRGERGLIHVQEVEIWSEFGESREQLCSSGRV